jgi:hypothetical protein
MHKTLARKELRETSGIAALALLANLAIVAWPMGVNMMPGLLPDRNWIPFVDDPVLIWTGAATGVLALALGFRQTAWESIAGTDLFLLHRPLGRRTMIAVKLAAGTLVVLACGSLPTLIYAWWAATPGTHASPFEWSMTWPFWRLWLLLITVYLGGYLSGIRPARWAGTRLAPAAGTVCLVVLLAVMPWRAPWWALGWTACALATNGLLIVGIVYTMETRDF